ncbi:hypothetical protein ACM55M_00275 [Flavobacterium sp. ZT3R25]|uniref:hypothetical protein n=1 Tax=Flavobacterium galactosi TaxID=3398735 RepID=UPI003A8A2295
MRYTNLKNKTVCFLLVIVLNLQSCAVYKKAPVTLDQAVVTNRKILIIKTDNAKLKLINIEQIDGNYYGYIKTKRKIEKIPLIESDLKTIRVLDRTTTTIGNVAIVVGSLGIVLLVVAAIELSNWDTYWGDWGTY